MGWSGGALEAVQTWKFRWDEDALLLQMRDGISNPEREDMEIIYVGSLKASAHAPPYNPSCVSREAWLA